MSTTWPPEGTRPLSVDVVSVQSQVIYGRVGNNVAVPTFMRFGLSVASVPTVLLSNTPHYASLHGGPLPLAWFEGYLNDLAARGALTNLRAVQCGYLGNVQQARALADWIRLRRVELPKLRVVIDPVIGDHDKGVYVDPALVDVYREHLLPLADVITPNDFELSCLIERQNGSIESTVAAARRLLRGRMQWVVVTSAAPSSWSVGSMQILMVGADAVHCITHPFVDAAPKGTGDLFAATFTAQWLDGMTCAEAARSAAAQVVNAMRLTRDARCAELLLPDTGIDRYDAEVSLLERIG